MIDAVLDMTDDQVAQQGLEIMESTCQGGSALWVVLEAETKATGGCLSALCLPYILPGTEIMSGAGKELTDQSGTFSPFKAFSAWVLT